MRILLDENFPIDFANLFMEHEVLTVHRLGWLGIKNGELLRRAHGICEVFITLDRHMESQQNMKVLPFGIVVVYSRSNRMSDLTPQIPSILAAVSRVAPGQVEKAGI